MITEIEIVDKTCTKCKKDYPATAEHFPPDSHRKDGYHSWCRVCHRLINAAYQKTTKGKKAHKRHRQTISAHLRRVFNNAKRRCNNPECRDYRNYGGRGIEVRFKSFDGFIKHVNSLGYDTYNKIKDLQIDRIDNDGHYEPGNIRFTTRRDNLNNRRQYKKRK